MKLTMFVATMFGVATSVGDAAVPSASAYFQSLEAPPEAMFMGASLLFIAAMLRSASRQLKDG
jgi:hypothetical protein